MTSPPSRTVDSEAAAREQRYMIAFEESAAEHRPRFVVAADGSWLELADGTRLLDLHGQYMCVGMGHGHPRMRQALHEAVDGLDYVCEILTHEGKGLAAELLCDDTMDGSEWAGAAKFVSTGSESVELALLIARLVKNRPVVVTMEAAYHGWTTGAAAATTLPYLRNVFHDLEADEFRTVPTPHAEFHAAPAPIDCETEANVGDVVERTERVIRAVGVENVAGLITELYNGAGGYLVPDSYPAMVREMCDRLGILWIDDEVIAGTGRTGRWWAFQHYGVTPDIMCAAKGLSSSSVPAGVVVMSNAVADYLRRGRWAAVTTFGAHPLAVAGVAANIQIMLDEHVVEHVAEVGEEFGRGLQALVERHPSALRISGRGLAWSIELCKDSATGEKWVPADRWLTPSVDGAPAFMPGRFIAEECEKHGVLLFNFVPNTVTIAPPLKITRDELTFALEALEKAFTALDEHTVSARD